MPNGMSTGTRRLSSNNDSAISFTITVNSSPLHLKNIEAIGNVIMRYEDTYPEIRVSIMYECEEYYRTKYWNNLFPLSWMNVRYGDQLVIILKGNGKIQDILRLKQYLDRATGVDYEDVRESMNLFSR